MVRDRTTSTFRTFRMAISTGTVTCRSTSSGARPGKVVMTCTIWDEMSG